MTFRLFAGPSACGLAPDCQPDAGCSLPPVRRGDVDRLVDRCEPGVMVLCDGIFDAVPAVSHAEICRALDGGWQVWGVASLGAIRAWELRDEGMKGHGRVYAMFAQRPDFSDDEMCLLHGPEAPYFQVTEALVNVRVALQEHGAACGIGNDAAEHLLDQLGRRWFGERSEALIRRTLVDEAGVPAAAVATWLERLRGSRVKNRDLADLLRSRPWARGVTE